MKLNKFFLTLSLSVAAAITAQAQFTGASGSSSGSSVDAPDSFDQVTISYDAGFYSGKSTANYRLDGEDDGMTSHGVAIQYVHGWRVSDAHPLYVTLGGRLDMGFYSDSDSNDDFDFEVKCTVRKLSLSVPVNIGYRISCGETISIMPYTGIHLKGNLLGKGKYEVSRNGDSEDKSFDLFDKDDVGKDGKWKRLQFGWQIGCQANIGKFIVGLEYGLDFNSLAKKLNTSDFLLSVGVTI